MIAPTKVIDICRACANRGWVPDVIELTDRYFEQCKPFVKQAIKAKLDLIDPPGQPSVGKSRIVDDGNLVLLGLTIRRGSKIRAGYRQGKKILWEDFNERS